MKEIIIKDENKEKPDQGKKTEVSPRQTEDTQIFDIRIKNHKPRPNMLSHSPNSFKSKSSIPKNAGLLTNSNSDHHFMNTLGTLDNYVDSKRVQKKPRVQSSKQSQRSGGIINLQKQHRPMQSTMENYSDYTKQLYKSIDLIESKRANSAKPIKIRGIKYKFQLQNVAKY